ncbi:MAG: 3'(2'),5'-bisphosphate nucleotidase CysQ [Sedimentisphaerales bacterium]|nr:3'(2'),5'-bisphosphate nucleotidase CysQ [Sedimentisphaerales bacterium]
MLKKIEQAFQHATEAVMQYKPEQIEVQRKSGGDPVTQADRELDEILQRHLWSTEEGWLSEETTDDRSRLDKRRVWIVDPLDGTREFVEGIDEWSISVALVENEVPVAAGVCNPWRGEIFLGSRQMGVQRNGRVVKASDKTNLNDALVLASRTEYRRGQWENYTTGLFHVEPMGSVAYKLARVAAGLADATFTLEPKNEWDVAAGVLLVEAAGGSVQDTNGRKLRFNQADTQLPGLIASGPGLWADLVGYVHSTRRRISK